MADYEPQTGAIVVRAGKGNKDQRVYALYGTIAALDAWLEVAGTAPARCLAERFAADEAANGG